MASINARKDCDGIVIGWQAQVRRKGFPAQSKTFEKKGQAQAWARQVESEMERGVFSPRGEAERTTVGECLGRYLREVTPLKKEGRGQSGERGFISQWLKRPLSKRTMASVRSVDIGNVILDMQAEGKGANTVRLHLAVLSNLFTVAKSNWGMESLENPVAIVRKPKLPPGRERRLRSGEAGTLLGATSLEFACLIVFALETAMRLNEIAALTWENVNLDVRTAFLPKTKISEARTVPLSPAAIEALTMRRAGKTEGSIFDLSCDGIDSAWDRARDAAGMEAGWDEESLHFHDLRHEATSRFFERTDLDIMEIKGITGHRTLQMLARYTHLRVGNLAARLAGERRGAGYLLGSKSQGVSVYDQ
ncbi:MAG: site-specific integrase [Acidithiobacillus ferrivorans]|jgi:integrase|uniref:site-specific integrase n=1 Tax=Acidithiobacillus sp. TaxID=1872118 RepID=UPI0019D2758F|nr:site-specific integrase [Acidithiobacillus sp. MC6.1]